MTNFASKILRLSNFAIPIERDGNCLIFVTKSCNFYKFDKVDFVYLTEFAKDIPEIGKDELDNIQPIVDIGILSTAEEDRLFVEDMEISHNVIMYSPTTMVLTIVPTISCNLRCPYCFEENKPAGTMSVDVADNLLKFIEEHVDTRQMSVTWFGGEPLLGFEVIEYLLPKLYHLKDKKIVGHSIVTNGTLLTKEKFELFKKYPLDSIQITLDGEEETHNSKRFFPNGKGTFNLILDNIEKFAQEFPKTSISVRINVDNKNSEQYHHVADKIAERFKGKNVSTYPGILIANKGCEDEQFFSSKDHVEFQGKLWNKGTGGYGYPSLCSKGCSATSLSSYIVGPSGEIYKCWEHVGNYEKVVGNITSTSYKNYGLFNDFILRGLCFSDLKCRDCSMLPICSGGCPRKRVDNLTEESKSDLCCIYNGNDGKVIEEILYDYYTLSIRNQTSSKI
ncbi:MAG: radical SAM protein [Clostridium sp.]|nr:radical SAM protein [Prevotella sp.]MCM1428602.1 radical SAM protein [Clostridium sp.]